MQINNVPMWGAGGKGLQAQYTLNFPADSVQFIPLNGSFQGDGVNAQTLHINNLNNNGIITVTGTATYTTIPPFSDGFIDIRGMSALTFTSPGSIAVPITLLNYIVAEGFVTRGNNVAGIASDPNFAGVEALYHFEGNNGATFALDSSSQNNNLTLGAGSTISTAWSAYGSSSLFNGSTGTAITTSPALFNTTTEYYSNYTIEAIVMVAAVSNAPPNDSVLVGLYGSTLANGIGIKTNGTAGFFVSYAGSLGATNGGIFNVLPTVYSPNLAYGVPHYVSFNAFGNGPNGTSGTTSTVLCYADGVQFSSASALPCLNVTNGVTQKLMIGPRNPTGSGYYIDELRLSTVGRYPANYTPQTQAFFNQ